MAEVLSQIRPPSSGVQIKKKQKPIFVVKINCLPYGFFEKQLWEYFTQFGTVARARVSRSKKGWAYVGFEDKGVAEVAAETMNGYLMFEKRLLCHVMEKVPKCMQSGPRYVAPPHMKGQAIKNAKLMNSKKKDEKEDKLSKRRAANFKKLGQKLKELGVAYDLSSVPSLTVQSIPSAEDKDPNSVQILDTETKRDGKKINKKVVTKKTAASK